MAMAEQALSPIKLLVLGHKIVEAQNKSCG